MIFFTQLAGNSSQIFISEVFPTNARASGFGLAQVAGRAGAAVAILVIPLIQKTWSETAVFAAIAVIVAIGAADGVTEAQARRTIAGVMSRKFGVPSCCIVVRNSRRRISRTRATPASPK